MFISFRLRFACSCECWRGKRAFGKIKGRSFGTAFSRFEEAIDLEDSVFALTRKRQTSLSVAVHNVIKVDL